MNLQPAKNSLPHAGGTVKPPKAKRYSSEAHRLAWAAGWPFRRLAGEFDVSQSFLSQMFRGRARSERVERGIAELLGIEHAEFVAACRERPQTVPAECQSP